MLLTLAASVVLKPLPNVTQSVRDTAPAQRWPRLTYCFCTSWQSSGLLTVGELPGAPQVSAKGAPIGRRHPPPQPRRSQPLPGAGGREAALRSHPRLKAEGSDTAAVTPLLPPSHRRCAALAGRGSAATAQRPAAGPVPRGREAPARAAQRGSLVPPSAHARHLFVRERSREAGPALAG